MLTLIREKNVVDPIQAHELDKRLRELIRELIFNAIRDCYNYGNKRIELLGRGYINRLPIEHKKRRTRLMRFINCPRFQAWLVFLDMSHNESKKFLAELTLGAHLEKTQGMLAEYEQSRKGPGKGKEKGKARHDEEEKHKQAAAEGRRSDHGGAIAGGSFTAGRRREAGQADSARHARQASITDRSNTSEAGTDAKATRQAAVKSGTDSKASSAKATREAAGENIQQETDKGRRSRAS